MINAPLISIITVVYNGEKYLKQAIESVINQTYKNIEYIIIDGGSTDNTLNIIKNYHQNISKWVSEPDNGLYDAMNKGIKLATGELIGMVNSDDWYELNAVEIIVNEYLKNDNKQIFHSDRYDVYKDGSRKKYAFNPSVFKFKYFSMTYSHPTMFVHRDIYKSYKYNISLTSISDYQFALEIYLTNKSIFHYIPQPTSNFRLGGISGQLPFKQILRENFMARRNAGMNYLQCVFAMIIRVLGEIYKKTKKSIIK